MIALGHIGFSFHKSDPPDQGLILKVNETRTKPAFINW